MTLFLASLILFDEVRKEMTEKIYKNKQSQSHTFCLKKRVYQFAEIYFRVK